MHIESITIQNLLSFKDAKFSFKKYNVIVGPNNAGKTNLVRILQAVVGGDLANFELPSKMKHDDNEQSQIRLAVEATDKETRMILQAMTDKPVGRETDLDLWRNFTVVFNWQELDMNRRILPTIIYFQNRTVAFIRLGKQWVSYHDPADMPDFEQYISMLCSMDEDQSSEYVREIGRILMHKNQIKNLLTDNDPKKFFLDGGKCYIDENSVALNEGTGGPHKRELAKYLNLKESTNHVALSRVVSKIMQDSFVQAVEMHPPPKDLSDELHKLKNRDENAYNHLRESFTEIFPNTTIKVEPRPNDGVQTIWITYGQKTFEITDSASGHLAAIYILNAILNQTERTIFLDEPEIHFHPAKIRWISQILQSITEDNSNQVMIITHSPKFIDPGLLAADSTSALNMVTKFGDVSLVAPLKSPDIRLKPHTLVTDVFFANAVFLVEGDSDESVIQTISDGIFDKYEIVVVNCGGVTNIKPYIDFLKAYSIKYYGMADREYRNNGNITVLDVNLDAELRALKTVSIQAYTQKTKPPPDVAYRYITDLLKAEGGYNELKTTKIWSSIENIMNGLGFGLGDFEKKYE